MRGHVAFELRHVNQSDMSRHVDRYYRLDEVWSATQITHGPEWIGRPEPVPDDDFGFRQSAAPEPDAGSRSHRHVTFNSHLNRITWRQVKTKDPGRRVSGKRIPARHTLSDGLEAQPYVLTQPGPCVLPVSKARPRLCLKVVPAQPHATCVRDKEWTVVQIEFLRPDPHALSLDVTDLGSNPGR